MYPVLLIFGLLLSVAVIFVQIKRAGLAAVAYYPITLFSLYFSIIHFLTPLVKYNANWFRYQDGYESIILVYSAVLSIFFLTFSVALNEIFARKTKAVIRERHRNPVSYQRNTIQSTFWFGLALASIGAFFAWRDLAVITDTSGGVGNFLLDRHLYSENRSVTRIFSNFLTPGAACILASALLSQGRTFKFAFFLAFSAITIYYANAISSRNTILIFSLINMCIFFFFSNQKSFKSSLLSIRTILLVVASVAVLAGAAYYTTLQRYSVSDSAYLVERRNAILFFALDGAFGNDEAQPWMIENGHDLYWGETYLAVLTNFVPRSIWPDKPLGAGPRLINMVRPGSFVVGQTGNNSLTTGLVVEARMNFGVPGVLFMIFLVAYISNRLTRSAISSTSPPIKVALVITVVALNSIFLYSEFLGFFFRFAMLVVPLVLIANAQRISFNRT